MGGKPKWTLLQRHTDGQKAHEKMLNTTNYQRNASQNYNEVSPHLVRMDIIKKNLQTVNAGENMEKGKPPTLLMGM